MDLLPKIGFYAGYPHLQQTLQQSLVPDNGLWIGKVNGPRIIQGTEVGPSPLFRFPDLPGIPVGDGLLQLLRSGGDIGKLPEADPVPPLP